MVKTIIQSEPENPVVSKIAEDSQPVKLVKRVNKKIVIGIVVLGFIVGVGFYLRGLIVAATVDGSPISRLSIVRQLEKRGGKNVLETLIIEKLIGNEAKKEKIVISDDEVNQEIKNIEASITQQGGTLKEALLKSGLSEEDLRKQIKTQKKLEKLLADKIQVTEEEVNTFITDNKIDIPQGKETEVRNQIKTQLRNQKINQEAQQLITELKAKAKIKYYVNY